VEDGVRLRTVHALFGEGGVHQVAHQPRRFLARSGVPGGAHDMHAGFGKPGGEVGSEKSAGTGDEHPLKR
jgi:hypothetical protein